MVNYGMTILSSSISGRIPAFYAKGPMFNPGLGILFTCVLPHAAVAALLSAVYDAPINWC